MTGLDFSNPSETLKTLTSETISYTDLNKIADNLMPHLSAMHINQDGRRFQAITQCILECIKRIHGFKSAEWISEKKLMFELKSGEQPINFTRINANQEVCFYRILNFDQIDFDKEVVFADEYEVVKKVMPENQVNEDDDYGKVLTLLENGENVFLTGFAGTGKSYILNKLKAKLKKNLTITSTTGIAAVNVKGQTLHSWAGVGLCRNTIDNTVEKIKKRPGQYRQILKCKILAVDEISMLNIETFEYVNEVLKLIRECDKPFGGIQVLFIGDFFQLPPVEGVNGPGVNAGVNAGVNGAGINTAGNGIEERRYCFDSPIWEELNLKNVVLKKNYRQSEENFIKALTHMRENCLDSSDIQLLNTRSSDIDTFETDILHIFSTNDEANKYNTAKFNIIEEPVRIFKAEDGVYRSGEFITEGFTESEKYILEIFSKNCRAEKEIALRLDARVMLLSNIDFNKGLINGACGKIQEFCEDGIKIKFDNGVVTEIPKHTFEYYYNDRVIAQRVQYPLKLAYGITIHKSQGMTLDKLVVDCARIFERGQAYVAMSRVKTLEGLYIKHFEPAKVLVDSRVVEFYKNLQEVKNVIPLKKEEEEIELYKSPEIDENIIIECVKEYSGLYGKTGFCRILKGSSQVKINSYNDNVISSKFFGTLKNFTRRQVNEVIDKLIEENKIEVKKINFGRPVLCAK